MNDLPVLWRCRVIRQAARSVALRAISGMDEAKDGRPGGREERERAWREGALRGGILCTRALVVGVPGTPGPECGASPRRAKRVSIVGLA